MASNYWTCKVCGALVRLNQIHLHPVFLDPESLDAAWAEAEAALPEGWVLTLNRHKDGSALAVSRSTAYRAGKGEVGVQQRLAVVHGPHGGIAYGEGPTPAAALRALAANLREVA